MNGRSKSRSLDFLFSEAMFGDSRILIDLASMYAFPPTFPVSLRTNVDPSTHSCIINPIEFDEYLHLYHLFRFFVPFDS